jgi:hypothetical protein
MASTKDLFSKPSVAERGKGLWIPLGSIPEHPSIELVAPHTNSLNCGHAVLASLECEQNLSSLIPVPPETGKSNPVLKPIKHTCPHHPLEIRKP